MIQNLLSYHLANLCNIAINLLMILNNYHYILLNYTWHYYINAFSIVYLYIIYFTFTVNKWSTIFKYYTFTSSACLADASSPASVIVIFPLTSMYA